MPLNTEVDYNNVVIKGTVELGVKGERGLQGFKGDQGIQGPPVPVAHELGDDPDLAVSQKLLTDSIADMEQSNEAAVMEATHQAGLAGDSAVIATEQAGISASRAGESAQSAQAASGSALAAGQHAITATEQAGITAVKAGEASSSAVDAAEQAGLAADSESAAEQAATIATTKADEASQSAQAAAQSAAQAEETLGDKADKDHTHVINDVDGLGDALLTKFDKTDVVQSTGQSAEKVMSQKAVTDALSLMTPIANNIGVAGQIGFGVGICPLEYDGMSEMLGTRIFGHDNYGNYQYKDGSVMAWVPAFFYRYGHPGNPTFADYGVNSIHVLPRSAYPTVLAAAVAGYALHRAFYDDGVEQPGFYYDKYLCSNNDGIASSIKNGKAITSGAAHYPFNGLTGSPSNNFAGAIAAAKTRGDDYFPSASFLFDALAKLSLAHAQAATSSAACAWYDSAGVSNFPKGCNNNALGDANDATVMYEPTGHPAYDKAGLTGSAQPFNKTTHNGQACGIADLNGLLWEILVGVTILDGSYYILKKEARMADLTAGVTLDTDAWGAAGLAKNYTELGPSFGALGTKSDRAIGSASQVFSSETEGLEWEAACSGIPLADGMGGTNLFGNDRLYDTNMPEHLCMAAGGIWVSSSNAGVWARRCSLSRTNASDYDGFRSALYLVKRSDSE